MISSRLSIPATLIFFVLLALAIPHPARAALSDYYSGVLFPAKASAPVPATTPFDACSGFWDYLTSNCSQVTESNANAIVIGTYGSVPSPVPATAPAPTPALDPALQNPYGGFYRFTPTSIPNTAEVQTSNSFVDSFSTGYGTDQSGFRSTYDDYYSTGYGTDQSGFRSANGAANSARSAPSRVSPRSASELMQWNDPTDATSGWTEDESYRAPWNDPTDATSGWTEDESYRTSGPRIEQQAPDSRYNEQFGTPSNPCDFAPGYISDGRGGCMSNNSPNPTVQPYTPPTPTSVNGGGIYDDGVFVGQRTGSGADLAPTYMTGWDWFDCTILRACNTAQTVAPVEDRSFSNSGLQLDYGGGYDPGGANHYVPAKPTTYPVQDYRGLVENPLPPSPTVYYPDYDGYEYGSNDIEVGWNSITFSDWYY